MRVRCSPDGIALIAVGIYGMIPFALNLDSWLIVLINRFMFSVGMFFLLTILSYMGGLSQVKSRNISWMDEKSIDFYIRSCSKYLNKPILLVLLGAWGTFISCFEGDVRSNLTVFSLIVLSAGLLFAWSDNMKKIGMQKGIEICERQKVPQC